MSDGYKVMPLDLIEGYQDSGRPRWHMLRSVLGIESFGINAWRATEDGQTVITEHDELGQGAGRHEELYLVLDGAATFTIDGRELDAPAGTVVYVRDPALKRQAVARTSGTVVLAIGGRPGEAFSVSPWEQSVEALRYWTTEEWDKAIAILDRQRAEHPDNAGVLYNLACAEARGGYTEDALAHLRSAIELEESFLEHAQTDTDLDTIRSDPNFPTT